MIDTLSQEDSRRSVKLFIGAYRINRYTVNQYILKKMLVLSERKKK